MKERKAIHSLLLTIGPKDEGNKVGQLIRWAVGFFQRSYLRCYQTFTPDKNKEMNLWSPVIAAARLSENIVPERNALIEMVN